MENEAQYIKLGDLIGTADVAEMFGVTGQTVANWRRDEGLPGYKLGPRTFRYSKLEVEAWFAARGSSAQGAVNG